MQTGRKWNHSSTLKFVVVKLHTFKLEQLDAYFWSVTSIELGKKKVPRTNKQTVSWRSSRQLTRRTLPENLWGYLLEAVVVEKIVAKNGKNQQTKSYIHQICKIALSFVLIFLAVFLLDSFCVCKFFRYG